MSEQGQADNRPPGVYADPEKESASCPNPECRKLRDQWDELVLATATSTEGLRQYQNLNEHHATQVGILKRFVETLAQEDPVEKRGGRPTWITARARKVLEQLKATS